MRAAGFRIHHLREKVRRGHDHGYGEAAGEEGFASLETDVAAT